MRWWRLRPHAPAPCREASRVRLCDFRPLHPLSCAPAPRAPLADRHGALVGSAMQDDLRPQLMEAYNHSWMKTPNIDRFSETALVFLRAYVQQQVC